MSCLMEERFAGDLSAWWQASTAFKPLTAQTPQELADGFILSS